MWENAAAAAAEGKYRDWLNQINFLFEENGAFLKRIRSGLVSTGGHVKIWMYDFCFFAHVSRNVFSVNSLTRVAVSLFYLLIHSRPYSIVHQHCACTLQGKAKFVSFLAVSLTGLLGMHRRVSQCHVVSNEVFA